MLFRIICACHRRDPLVASSLCAAWIRSGSVPKGKCFSAVRRLPTAVLTFPTASPQTGGTETRHLATTRTPESSAPPPPACVGRRHEVTTPPPHRATCRVRLPQRRHESWGYGGIRLYTPSCSNETLRGYWLGFFAIAIIDFASCGIRPTRLKWISRNPVSSSSCCRVLIDQILM